jgi:hypothetical protein
MTAMMPALIVHIAAGSIAILSGAAALSARKGERLHRMAGTVFFVSMLTMSALGAVMAATIPSRISVIAGALAFYLVATGWAAVKRRENSIGIFEKSAFAAALAIAAGGAALGVFSAISPTGRLDGLPPGPAYGFAFVAALAAVMDLKVIRQGGISGAPRIARHLWRMCTALLIAAFSFFLGQQKVMPAFLRGSPVLFLPEIAVLGAMVFWLIRVRAAGRLRRKAPAS